MMYSVRRGGGGPVVATFDTYEEAYQFITDTYRSGSGAELVLVNDARNAQAKPKKKRHFLVHQ